MTARPRLCVGPVSFGQDDADLEYGVFLSQRYQPDAAAANPCSGDDCPDCSGGCTYLTFALASEQGQTSSSSKGLTGDLTYLGYDGSATEGTGPAPGALVPKVRKTPSWPRSWANSSLV